MADRVRANGGKMPFALTGSDLFGALGCLPALLDALGALVCRMHGGGAPQVFTAESVEDRRQFILDHVHELAGKKLGCWCDQTGPCHAKVLARMADEAVARD